MESYRLRHFRQVLGDRYEFQAFLGRGAFASVYLVQNLKLKRREALKILSDTFEPDSTARFVAEATMVASLDHPNIVQVYDYGEVEGVVWYSMQYIEGPMLRDEMWVRKRFDPVLAVRIVIPLLGALEASHRRGIVHRDIKPSNIILNREGRPYLMDFGIAKASDAHLKTMTGSVLGTPAFMAPEQAEGKPLDGRADLYSLGLVLYQMLAGCSPFDTQEPVQLLLLRLREDPPRLATRVKGIDPELEAIVMKTLARDREGRFASARELERHLVAFLGDDRDLPPIELAASVFQLQPLEADSEPTPGGPPVRPPSSGATISLGPGGKSPAQTAPRDQPQTVEREPGSSVWTRGRSRRRGALALLALAVFGSAVLAFVLWFGGYRLDSPKAQASAPSPAPPKREIPAAVPADDARGGTGAAAPASSAERAVVPGSLPAAAQPAPSPRREAESPASVQPEQAAPVAAAVPRRAVRAPRLVEQGKPSFSGDAAARCAGVSLIVSVEVGEDGKPTRVRFLGSSPAECRAPAEAAARQFRFEPAQDIDGRPVTATVTLSIPFGETP